MIARVWHGWTKREDADGYQAHLKPDLLPGLSQVKGFLGSYVLRRAVGEQVEFVTVIFWESLEDVRAVAGPDYETAVIPEERRSYLQRFDAQAAHYEVVTDRRPGR